MINGGVAYALGIPAWIAGTIAGITLLVIVVLLHALAGAIDEME
jgi:hypothetical protein